MKLNKVALVGSNGYIGSYFYEYLTKKDVEVIPLYRHNLHDNWFLKSLKVDFLINAAGYTGKPNVDACEDNKEVCFLDNVILPWKLSKLCNETGLKWAHISSGCIYNGARTDGAGFTEEDSPNFCFRSIEPCSFYSGTKALGEESLKDDPNCYIWRIRIPFDENLDNPRNFLYKVKNYEKLLNARNSLTYIRDFVSNSIKSVEMEIPFGIYNFVNGDMWTKDVCSWLNTLLVENKNYKFFDSLEDFNKIVRTPRSNCVLSYDKLIKNGIEPLPIINCLVESVRNYQYGNR